MAIRVQKRYYSGEQRKGMAESGAALPDGSFPINDAIDLHNAIALVHMGKNPELARQHIIRRAGSLGLTSKLPESWGAKKAEFDHILKFNKYHDPKTGRFTSKGGGILVSGPTKTTSGRSSGWANEMLPGFKQTGANTYSGKALSTEKYSELVEHLTSQGFKEKKDTLTTVFTHPRGGSTTIRAHTDAEGNPTGRMTINYTPAPKHRRSRGSRTVLGRGMSKAALAADTEQSDREYIAKREAAGFSINSPRQQP